MAGSRLFTLTPELVGKYSDVTIHLSDQEQTISLELHRIFLSSIGYFERLFNFADNLHRSEFTIPVDDAEVARFFLLSLYGKEPKYTFVQSVLLIRLKDYLGITIYSKDFHLGSVPAEDYDFYFRAVTGWLSTDKILKDGRLLNILSGNLPGGFEMEKIDPRLRKEISKRKYRFYYKVDGDFLCIIDRVEKTRVKITLFIYFVLSNNGRYLIIRDDKKIYSFDLEKGLVLRKYKKVRYDLPGYIHLPTILEDNEDFILFEKESGTLEMWNIISGECLWSVELEDVLKIWSISGEILISNEEGFLWIGKEDGRIIPGYEKYYDEIELEVFGSKDKEHLYLIDRKINVWSIAKRETVFSFEHKAEVRSSYFDEEKSEIFLCGDPEVKSFNLKSGKFEFLFRSDIHIHFGLFFTSGEIFYLLAGNDSRAGLWEVEGREKIREYVGDKEYFHVNFLTNVNLFDLGCISLGRVEEYYKEKRNSSGGINYNSRGCYIKDGGDSYIFEDLKLPLV